MTQEKREQPQVKVPFSIFDGTLSTPWACGGPGGCRFS